eukprot:344942-Hanusia_phi.AAC.2
MVPSRGAADHASSDRPRRSDKRTPPGRLRSPAPRARPRSRARGARRVALTVTVGALRGSER